MAGAVGRICLQEPLQELCESPQSGTVWGSDLLPAQWGRSVWQLITGGRRRACGLWEGGVAGREAAGKEVVKAYVSCDTRVSGLLPLENRHRLPN